MYPSYPKDAKPEEISKALIVSYAWTQDAERIGALINADGTAKPELIKVVFRDLAAVHGVSVEWLEQFYTDGDYFAWDWYQDPLTMGSRISLIVATTLMNWLFQVHLRSSDPGCTIARMYTAKCFSLQLSGNCSSLVKRPVPAMRAFLDNRSSERASDQDFVHSWVAGALDSAWRAVDQYLALHHPTSLRDKFWEKWGTTEYWDETSNKDLVKLNHDLTDRHLVISLVKSGLALP